ncbi:MAG TPA: hypothetical protein VIK71_01680 [Flavobacteriales bacterium]
MINFTPNSENLEPVDALIIKKLEGQIQSLKSEREKLLRLLAEKDEALSNMFSFIQGLNSGNAKSSS